MTHIVCLSCTFWLQFFLFYLKYQNDPLTYITIFLFYIFSYILRNYFSNKDDSQIWCLRCEENNISRNTYSLLCFIDFFKLNNHAVEMQNICRSFLQLVYLKRLVNDLYLKLLKYLKVFFCIYLVFSVKNIIVCLKFKQNES